MKTLGVKIKPASFLLATVAIVHAIAALGARIGLRPTVPLRPRRTGYGGHGAFHLPEITAECRELRRLGRKDYRARLAAKSKTRSDRDAAGRKVNAVIRNLDADGRWLADGRLQKNTPVEKVISTKVVIANGNGRCDYLVSRDHAAGRAP